VLSDFRRLPSADRELVLLLLDNLGQRVRPRR